MTQYILQEPHRPSTTQTKQMSNKPEEQITSTQEPTDILATPPPSTAYRDHAQPITPPRAHTIPPTNPNTPNTTQNFVPPLLFGPPSSPRTTRPPADRLFPYGGLRNLYFTNADTLPLAELTSDSYDSDTCSYSSLTSIYGTSSSENEHDIDAPETPPSSPTDAIPHTQPRT